MALYSMLVRVQTVRRSRSIRTTGFGLQATFLMAFPQTFQLALGHHCNGKGETHDPERVRD